MGQKRILITGATGYVGRNLVPRLVDSYEVICLVRDSQTAASALPAGVQMIQADLATTDFVDRLPPAVDVILHMAVAPPSLGGSALNAYQVNSVSTLCLLEYARKVGVEAFIFTSSGNVYAPQPDPITEDIPPAPSDLLGVAKYASEMLLSLYGKHFRPIVLRLFHPYGPGQPDNILIPRLISKIRDGGRLVTFRNKGPTRSFIFIDDLVEVFSYALNTEADALTLNVAGPIPYRIYDICELIGQLVGRKPVWEFRDEEPQDLIADVRRMEAVLEYKAQTTLEEGIRRCLS
jgi:UDP-glucose 4-epimerase